MKTFAEETFELANQDFKVCIHLFSFRDKDYYRIICYHCQQAAEKYLKALLAHHSVKPPRIHNLLLLLHEVQRIDDTFPDIDVEELEDYAVLIRYAENLEPDPSPQRLEDAIQVAMKVRELVAERLPFVQL